MRLGPLELLLILAIVILLFGASRLPQLARGLGASIKEFRKGVAGEEESQKDSEKRQG